MTRQIDYYLHLSNKDPRRFMIYENRHSKFLDDHLSKPHSIPLFSRIDEVLDGEIGLQLFTMLSAAPD